MYLEPYIYLLYEDKYEEFLVNLLKEYKYHFNDSGYQYINTNYQQVIETIDTLSLLFKKNTKQNAYISLLKSDFLFIKSSSDINSKSVKNSLVLAIKYCNKSLSFFKKNLLNSEYVMTTFKLFTIYQNLSFISNRKNILEKCIYLIKEILKFENQNYFGFFENESINFLLGTLYSELSKIKDNERNLKKAITHFEQALSYIYAKLDGYDFTKFSIICKLGESFISLSNIKDNERNLKKAITHFEQALSSHYFENNTLFNAEINNNIGIAYACLSTIENRETNLKKAITHFEQALSSDYFENSTLFNAKINNNIGLAYVYLSIIENRETNLKKTITHFEQALSSLDKEDFPDSWRVSYNIKFLKSIIFSNLGNAYYFLSDFEKEVSSLNKSIYFYKKSVKFFKKNNLFDYSVVISNISISYEKLIKLKRKDIKFVFNLLKNSIELSKGGYQKIDSYKNLSNILIQNFKYEEAFEYLYKAIKYIEEIRKTSFDKKQKEQLHEYSIGIYMNMIETCIRLNKYQDLVYYIELSKCRSLIDAINNNENRVILDEAIINPESKDIFYKIKELENKLFDIKNNISNLEDNLKRGFRQITTSEIEIYQENKRLEEEHKNLLEKFYNINENLRNRLDGRVIKYDEIKELFIEEKIDKNTAIIQYYYHPNEGLIINYISKNKLETFIISNKEELDKLFKMISRYKYYLEFLGNNINSEKLQEENSDLINNNPFQTFDRFLIDYIGKEAYKLIYKPFESLIEDESISRLIFVTDNLLHNFSFNILKSQEMALDQYITINKKIQFMKMSSISPWLTIKDKVNIDIKSLSAFCISNYCDIHLNLVSVKKELKCLSESNFQSKRIFTENIDSNKPNYDVNPGNIKNNLNANILAFSMHGGIVNKRLGILYPNEKNNNDLFLPIESIYREFPSIENNVITLLSLCYGGHNIVKNYEIESITSLFFMLGSTAIISNITPLYDDFGADFTVEFYKLLDKNINEKDDKSDDKLDIFYKSLKQCFKNPKYKNPKYWAFLEFSGNPKF